MSTDPRRSVLPSLLSAIALVVAGIAASPPAGPPDAVEPGSWRATGSMSQAREGGGAGNGDVGALLHDGRVLVAGGFTTKASHDIFTFMLTDNYLSQAEIYDPVDGTWEATAPMSESRFGPILVTLASGKVLAAGGYGGGFGTWRRSAELYDPETGAWEPTGSLRDCRGLAVSVVLNDGRVLVPGGLGCDSTTQASVEVYDPAAGTWTVAADMSTARQAHIATLLPDGRVLVAGGRTAEGPTDQALASAEIYDPETDTWTETSPLNLARYFHSGALLSDGRVLVAGGRCPGQMVFGPSLPTDCKTPTAELYDPATGVWTETGSMARARIFAGSVVLPRQGRHGERFMIAGGGQSPTVELYDPASGEWTATGSMSRVRDDAQLILLRTGDVLIAGGFEVQSPFYRTTETAELFRPSRG